MTRKSIVNLPLARLLRLRRDKRGIAATEFGFIAPIFIMMLMGIFDQGYSMYIQSALQGAVQEGARQASLENTLWSDIQDRVNAQVRQVIPTSDPTTVISFTLDPAFYQNYNDIELPENFEDKERGAHLNGTYDGPEPYTDSNGNGRYDEGEPFTDTNSNNRYTLGETFTDSNGNGRRDAGEPYIDSMRDGVFDGVYQNDEWYVDRNGNNQWDEDVGIAGRGGAQDVVSIKASIIYNRIFPLWKFVGQPQQMELTATTYLRNQPFSAQAARVGVRKCATTC
jgi:hypothetical protein